MEKLDRKDLRFLAVCLLVIAAGGGDHDGPLPPRVPRGLDRVQGQPRRSAQARRDVPRRARREARGHSLRRPVRRRRDGQDLSRARARARERRAALRPRGQDLAVADALVPLRRQGGGARRLLAARRPDRLPVGPEGGRAGSAALPRGSPRPGAAVPRVAGPPRGEPPGDRGDAGRAAEPDGLGLRGREDGREARRRHDPLRDDGLGRPGHGLPRVRPRAGGAGCGTTTGCARRTTRRARSRRPASSRRSSRCSAFSSARSSARTCRGASSRRSAASDSCCRCSRSPTTFR